MRSILSDKRLQISHGKNTVIHTLLKKGIDRSELTTYHEFIKSEVWEEIKKAWFKKYGKRCMKCNSHRLIHLHHIVYPTRKKGSLGTYAKVQDKHFISLCASCHKEYHDTYGVHQDMISTSIKFVTKSQWNKVFLSPKRKKKQARKINMRKKQSKNKSINSLLMKQKKNFDKGKTVVRKSLTATELLSL